MTPDEVRELAKTVRGRLAGNRWNEGDAALTALTDELLRHLGAPRVPVKISAARLAEIERWCVMREGARFSVADNSQVYTLRCQGGRQLWWREFSRLNDGRWCFAYTTPMDSLRAALESPVVRRAGGPKVQEFEVEK